jgi:hypothetical protein
MPSFATTVVDADPRDGYWVHAADVDGDGKICWPRNSTGPRGTESNPTPTSVALVLKAARHLVGRTAAR